MRWLADQCGAQLAHLFETAGSVSGSQLLQRLVEAASISLPESVAPDREQVLRTSPKVAAERSLHPVAQLSHSEDALSAVRRSQMDMFLQTQRDLNAASSLREHAAQLLSSTAFKEHDVELASLEAERMVLATLQQEYHRLSLLQQKAQHRHDMLAAERQKVQERQVLISAQRDAIAWAVAANAQLCQKLPNERARGEAVLRHQLVPAVQATRQVTESSRGRVATRLKEFAQQHAERGESVLSAEALFESDDSLVRVATALMSSPWQSSEAFLRAFCDQREELDRQRDRSSTLSTTLSRIRTSRVEELLELDLADRLAAQEKECNTQWIAALSTELDRLQEGVAHAEVVKQRSEEWWEQPAQHCTPDVPIGHSTFAAEFAALRELAEQ